jgi:phosphate starvation-inducible PhoH-like protein
MTEKTILIDIEDFNKFYGVREINFAEFVKHFPKLKIIARGDIVKVAGEIEEISIFEIKLQALITHFHKFNRLSPTEVKEIVGNGSNLVDNDEEGDVLLYSIYGKPIKGKTKNQKILIEEFRKNDLIFAIGPAGT